MDKKNSKINDKVKIKNISIRLKRLSKEEIAAIQKDISRKVTISLNPSI